MNLPKYKEKVVFLKDTGRLDSNTIIHVNHNHQTSCARYLPTNLTNSEECNCNPVISELSELPVNLSPPLSNQVVTGKAGWHFLHTMEGAHPFYAPPQTNLDCKCWPNLLKAHFCLIGHMTECHYPMNCKKANCSHLVNYYV